METPVKVESIDFYTEWQKKEGVPTYGGAFIQDLNAIDLGAWKRKGGRGAFVNMDGAAGLSDMQVVEIAPGKESAPERHIYEELVQILSGSGTTSVWVEKGPKQAFEWGPGSLFVIPLNAYYQHFNVSGGQPVRYISVTNAPVVLRQFHNTDFVFNNPYVFSDRFSGDEEFFKRYIHVDIHNPRLKKPGSIKVWETNFVPDLRALQLYARAERGGAGSTVGLLLGEASLGSHVAQFAAGTYKLAHRHRPGAHVVVLGGQGYSLFWKDGDTTRTRCDWKNGSLFVPDAAVWHQHFNAGTGPASYMSMSVGGSRYRHIDDLLSDPDASEVSFKLGGNQINYEDEDPAIHREFEAELAKHGARCHMRGLVAGCSGDVAAVVAEPIAAAAYAR